MRLHRSLLPCLLAAALLPAGLAAAAQGAKAEPKGAKRSPVAPLPPGPAVKWSHSPFEAGDCSICHERNDPKSPGPISGSVNELCAGCHEEVAAIMARKVRHAAAAEACTNCHNPHNSPARKLLVADVLDLCLGCHKAIADQVQGAPVKHDALTTGQRCLNCHDPHASAIEKLLVQLPYDLCLGCHSADGMKARDGKTMTNFKALLAENKVWHEPVRAKDCSACHLTHGSENFRLLAAPYPATFYAPYDARDYALCYGCHSEKAISTPETSTLTAFRDGTRNLHFVHVMKQQRGRSCRACHEVHAARQDHQIRDAVPFGPKSWPLKVNYTRTPTGGQCARTCHETKTYDYRTSTRAGR